MTLISGERTTMKVGIPREVKNHEYPPVARPVAGLLEQFPPRRGPGRLPGHVAQAGRDLPEQPAHGVPVLPDQ